MLSASCSASETLPNPTGPDGVVEAAARAFALGFTSRDLSSLDDFFVPRDEQYGTAETLDAARKFLDSMPRGTHMEIDSFVVTDLQTDPPTDEAVVSYEAAIHITLPGEIGSEVTVNQDVALEWRNGRWLITGADPAEVDGTIPRPP